LPAATAANAFVCALQSHFVDQKGPMAKSSIFDTRAKITSPNTGIGLEKRALLADGLAKLLAEHIVLEFKVRVAGWNAAGALFLSLREMSERQESDLNNGIHVLAKRIRALGYLAPERLSAIIERSELDTELGVVEGSARDMLGQLKADHLTIVREIRVVAEWAEQMKDQVTFNLLADLSHRHEETVWMLEAMLINEVGK
jgi:starvation-inducible DNA-binding protein